MYESIDSSVKACPWGGVGVTDYECPNKMNDWLNVLLDILDENEIKNDQFYQGLVVYAYMDTTNHGVKPSNVSDDFLDILKKRGYF